MREEAIRTRVARHIGGDPVPGKPPAVRYEFFCGACGERISRFALTCPACGERVLLSEKMGGE